MNKLVRIPQASDYRAAVELEDEALKEKGGAWVEAMLYEQETRSKASSEIKSKKAGNVANIMEPLDDNNVAYDRNLRVTRAFKHGMLRGFNIVDIVHNDMIDYDGIVGGLGAILTQRHGEVSKLEAWQDTLTMLGEEGFARFDEATKAKVDEWAKEYDSETRLQKLYALGTGAVIYSGYHIHQGFIEKQVFEETKSFDWLELLPPTTGE